MRHLALKHFGLAVAAYVCIMAATCSAPADPTPSYVWYPASSVAELKAQLNATDAPMILKVKPGNADTVWLQLVPDASSASFRLMTDSNPPIDDSHRCPPAC